MLFQERRIFRPHRILRLSALLSILGLWLFAVACGGGGSSTNGGPQPQPPALTSLQFKIGDAPADQLMGLEVSLTAVHVRDSHGNLINVLPATRRLEFLHTAGTLEPVALLDVPQGTYSEATFQGSNLHVSWVTQEETGLTLHETAISDLGQVTVPISPVLTVGANPMIVSIDFDVANFISFDSNGNPILNDPKFTFSAASPEIPYGPFPYPEIGGLEDMLGMVTNVSGSAFTMTLGQNGMPLTFNTDNNTVFDGVSLGTLPNTIVKVIGVTRSDGSIWAQHVQALENQQGVETEGVIYWYWGSGVQFWLTPQDGNGTGFEFNPTTAIGRVVNVNIDSGTAYTVNTDGMDMTGAAFTFDANLSPTSMRFGQRVRVESSTGMINDPGGTAGLIAGQKIILEKQAVSGTVSHYQETGEGRASFVLELPSDSYLTMLNSVQWPPATYVNVWKQAGTNLHGISSIKDGDTVRVRGLLFTDQGNFIMVAQRIWK